MHILVTNDDGVSAPGLAALASALRAVGCVTVVAPDRNWSASGHVKTMHKPLRVHPSRLGDGSEALACSGAPSDCVALGVLGLLDEPVDLVVAGINPDANMGHDLTYSGTVTAAMEAAIWNVPAIAVSVKSPERPGFAVAARYAAELARRVAENGLPRYTLLNLNLPDRAEDEIEGVCVTTQGLSFYPDEMIERRDPRGRPYYWIGGAEAPIGSLDDGTDFAALAEGYVSVTPLRLDLTAHDLLDTVRGWGL